jgi:GntR family transcriptional regulator
MNSMKDKNAAPFTSLSITPVKADSPVPLYYQIENDLRRLIGAGKIPPGTTMPPELELCRLYGVGRHTMRMALSRLAADDLITRRAGRGTVVKPQTERIEFYLDRSFTRQMVEMGLEPHSKVLEVVNGQITAESPEILRQKEGESSLHLVRLRFGGKEPIGLQSTTILTAHCPGLDQYDFNQESLYDVLARNYQLVITEIKHTISATIADDFHAQLLRVTEGDPLLLVKTSAFVGKDQVIEHTLSHYRADKYEYRTTHVYIP